MSNLKKFALQPTTIHHLKDGADQLMYADGPDGKPDKSKPMRAHMYGPGTTFYAAARAEQSNLNMERFKKKKSGQTAEEQIKERAEFLARCTVELENVEVGTLTGKALFMNVYEDLGLCFIPEQLDRLIGDTANFTASSATA